MAKLLLDAERETFGIDAQAFLQALSLDCTVPFWSSLGLDFSANNAARISEAAKHAYSMLLGDQSDPYLIDYAPARVSGVLNAFAETVRNALGDSAVDKLSAWAIIFRDAISDRDGFRQRLRLFEFQNGRNKTPLALPAETQNELMRLIDLHLSRSLENRLAAETGMPRTAWDARVFESTSGTGSPVDAWESVFAYRNLRALWVDIETRFLAGEVLTIRHWLADQPIPSPAALRKW